jgi:hypothetical protein
MMVWLNSATVVVALITSEPSAKPLTNTPESLTVIVMLGKQSFSPQNNRIYRHYATLLKIKI